MAEYKISESAYAKMIFHAAKYPHLSVNGVLLAAKELPVVIIDAIPLFHQCLNVTPMAEIALMLIDTFAESKNLIIAGYYVAAENFEENSINKAPAATIANKIYEHNKKACFIVIDNRRMSIHQPEAALVLYKGEQIEIGGVGGTAARWSKVSFGLDKTSLETVSALLKRGAMKDIIDFDEHLDNPLNDWTNEFFNPDLQQIMTLY